MKNSKTMSNSEKRKKGNVQLTHQPSRPYNTKESTNVTSKSKKLELESSSDMKEGIGQVKIELRDTGTSTSGISDQTNQNEFKEIKVEDEIELGASSISVQSIPTGDEERHNYQTGKVNIKIEDEMEFWAPSSSSRSIAGTDDEEHSNQNIQDEFIIIKLEDEIEFGEPSISVQSISTFDDEQPHSNQTIQDELSDSKDDMEFCDEVEMDALNNTETTVPDKPCNKKKSEFICDICSKKCSTKASLSAHRLRHGKPTFRCSVCGVNKFTQLEVDKHMITHDTNPKYFTCDICPKKYLRKPDLNEHRKRHGKPNFHCTVCGVAKFTKSEVDMHMRTHEIITNPILFTCDICSKKYSTKSNLSAHRARHGKPNFHCTVCGVSKFTQLEVDMHAKTHDANPVYFTCDICSKKYLRKADLIKHRAGHGKPNFNCNICGVAKSTQREMNSHMKIHDTTDPTYFTCDICSKKYLRKSHLNEHRLRHGRPNFQCTVCGLTKFAQYELNIHMKIHDANRTFFTCDICPKKCSKKSNLLEHMKTHDTNRVYFTCNICAKSYSAKANLVAHMKTHDNMS